MTSACQSPAWVGAAIRNSRSCTWDSWSAAGAKTFRQRACEKAQELLETHCPEPLPVNVAAALQRIIDRAAEVYV